MYCVYNEGLNNTCSTDIVCFNDCTNSPVKCVVVQWDYKSFQGFNDQTSWDLESSGSLVFVVFFSQ